VGPSEGAAILLADVLEFEGGGHGRDIVAGGAVVGRRSSVVGRRSSVVGRRSSVVG
jgi:hypothetical protein